MSYIQGHSIILPNNSMKLFTALLIHDVKHDFGPQRLWDKKNIIPVIELSESWPPTKGGLQTGGTPADYTLFKIFKDINQNSNCQKFKEYLNITYLISCGLYHRTLFDEFEIRMGNQVNEISFLNIVDSLNISIESLIQIKSLRNINIEDIDSKNSEIVIIQKLLINYISYIINSYYYNKPEINNTEILEAIYYTIIIYHNYTDEEIKSLLVAIRETEYYKEPDNDFHPDKVTNITLNTLFKLTDEDGQSLTLFLTELEHLFDIVFEKNLMATSKRKKAAEQAKAKAEAKAEAEAEEAARVTQVRERRRDIKREDTPRPRTLRSRSPHVDEYDELETVGGTLGCSAGLCIPDDTCNDDVDDSDEYTDEEDIEQVVEQVLEPAQAIGERKSSRKRKIPDFLHLDKVYFFGAIRAFLKKKTKRQKQEDLSDVEKVFAESNKSNTYLRFLIITNTVLACLVNSLYDHIDKLTVTNSDNPEDNNARQILHDYCNKNLYQKINSNCVKLFEKKPSESLLTKTTAKLDKVLFQKVVKQNISEQNLYDKKFSDKKIYSAEIFNDTNGKAYIINNAAIPANSDDRKNKSGNERILCSLSSIIDPAPPYLGGCAYNADSDLNELGNSDIKIESNFEPNGYIYYYAYQTLDNSLNVTTGYELFIGKKSEKKNENKNKIDDDYIYLANVNTQKLQGSPTGLSVVNTYSDFVTQLIKMAPNDVQNALINDDKRFEFLSIILLKSLGDMLQEFNGILKWGGYNPLPSVGTKIEPWNIQGDALRLVLSNDQPSASRIIIYKYIFPKEYLNNEGYGGYCHYHQSGNKEKTYTIIPFSKKSTATIPPVKSDSSSHATSSTDPYKKKAKASGITRKFIKKPKSLLKLSRKKNPIKKLRDILRQKKSRIKSQKRNKQDKKTKRKLQNKQDKQEKQDKKTKRKLQNKQKKRDKRYKSRKMDKKR